MQTVREYFEDAFRDETVWCMTWLYVGLQKYDVTAWPCFYEGRHEWAGHIFDWAESVRERARQEARRETTNPNYVNPHGSSCSCGICTWYGDEDQWDAEERAERGASKNIFFNDVSRGDVFDALSKDASFWEATRSCWESWNPMEYVIRKGYHTKPYDAQGAAKRMNPVKYVQEWRSSILSYLWKGDFPNTYRHDLSVYWGTFFRLYMTMTGFADVRDAIAVARNDCVELGKTMKEFYG